MCPVYCVGMYGGVDYDTYDSAEMMNVLMNISTTSPGI